MLDPLLTRKVRNVDEPLDSLFHFHKRSELRQPRNLSLDDLSVRIPILDRVPRISQDLPQPETQPLRSEFQDDGLHALALLKHIARAVDAFGPRHLRHVNQSL